MKKTAILKNSLLALALSSGLVVSACNQGSKTAVSQPQTSAAAPGTLTALSAEDVLLIVKTLPPQNQQMLAGNPEQVGKFLEDVKTLLAVAAEARKNGLADEPGNKEQLDFIAESVIASEFDKQNRGAGEMTPFASVKPEEIEAYYKEAGNEAKLNSFLELMKKRSVENGMGEKQFSEEEMKQLRENWAKIGVSANKAKAAGVDQKRETQLQIALQQARFLAQEYARRNDPQMSASETEVADYIKQHPELDSSKIKAKAEDVLKRAKSGEDFAKLAKEFSEDPGSKDNGGLYENVKKGQMVPEFENAAMALENGKVSENLVESNYGFHIIKLENKAGETYNVRHILLMTSAPSAGNPYAKPMGMKETATEAVKSQKREKWLAEITARNQITLPQPTEIKVEPPPPGSIPQMPMQPAPAEQQPKPEAPGEKKSKK